MGSNPGSDTTYGLTTYNYDALDRVTKVIPPDGTSSADNVSTSYDIVSGTNNCATVTDQAGKARKSCSDALGRLVQVFEDPASKNFETDYQYDVLNNLRRVDQKGTAPTDSTQWRTRTFTYNSLSQLLCAANPELTPIGTTCPNPDNGSYTAGTVRYAYDNDGNLTTKTSPKPNQTSASVTVLASYFYDNDNRLIKKTYNDGLTPTVQFAYDNNTLTGCTIAPPGLSDLYPAGRRTSMCDASGGTTWIHDKMGRITSERRSISAVRGDYDTDTYNLDGSIANQTALGYGIGYTYNSAGRVTQVQNFADPMNYVMAAKYAPFGGLTTANWGPKPISISNSYNKRLQPLTLSASTSSATIMSLSYNFGLGANDNGNVYQIANNRDSNRTQNFLYDSLNRIQQAYTTGTNWGETYSPNPSAPGTPPTTPGIDAWGNLTNRSTVTGKSQSEGLACPADKQNHLTTCSLTYDAAGNTIQNGSATYTYDAENRLITTAGMSYLYDGDGKRVEKCTAGTTAGTCATNPTGTLYWTGIGSDPLVETDLAGNVLEDYIFFNSQRIARREPGTTPTQHFYFSDHLGTHSLITDKNGTIPPQSESDYYPYGGEIPISGSDSNHYKFTGKERETETCATGCLDNFGARHNASALGRFMTVDAGGAHALNPQSWNRYAHTLNNPLRFVDPNGLEAVDIAVFWLTVWVPTGHSFVPGDLLTGFGSAAESSRPEASWPTGVGTPNPHSNPLTTLSNLSVADASDGPMCPPACTHEYYSSTHAYRLVAEFGTEASDSSKSTVTLSEKIVPNTSGMPTLTRWSSELRGPGPEFKHIDVRKSNIRKLSDNNLVALTGALFNAMEANLDDEALFHAWSEALSEEGRRVKKKKNCPRPQSDDPSKDQTQACE